MKNDKSWYEKIGIWLGIFASLFTIIIAMITIKDYYSKYNVTSNKKTGSPNTETTQPDFQFPDLNKIQPPDAEMPTNTITTTSEPVNTISTPEQISIRDVSEFYSDGIEHRKSTITDNVGESYEGFTFMSAGDFWVEPEGSVVYRNDNQYNRFLGRIIISQNEKNDKDCGWIKIYGDDNLLLDTGTMGRGIAPIDFDFDISMYSEIRIDFKDGEWSNDSYRYPQCYLVNTYFEVK